MKSTVTTSPSTVTTTTTPVDRLIGRALRANWAATVAGFDRALDPPLYHGRDHQAVVRDVAERLAADLPEFGAIAIAIYPSYPTPIQAAARMAYDLPPSVGLVGAMRAFLSMVGR